MSNSSLVNYTKITDHKGIWNENGTYWGDRTGPITKITIHHMAANASIEALGDEFSKPTRQASSNYGIGSDGRIGLYVEEKYRAWTSGSVENDGQAVTIEVADYTLAPNWTVSEAAWNSLVLLCVDICKRNGIKSLNWTGDSTGNLTTHDMFQNTNCPGPYLKSRMALLAEEVNAILNGKDPGEVKVTNPYKEPIRNIQYYTIGEDVKWVQWELNNCGYNVAIDGSFGPDSNNKIRQFQKDRNLTINGIVDKTVREYLKNPSKKNNPTKLSNPYKKPNRPLIKWHTGEDVKWLQWELNEVGYKLTIDGSFGPATDNAVRAYQKQKGLVVDGSVGPATQASLIND